MMENCSSENASERRSQLYQETRDQLKDNEQNRKYIIRNLAYSMDQEGLVPKECICEEIIRALKGCIHGVGAQYIRKCLEKRYKRKYEKKEREENAPPALNINLKKVPEEYTRYRRRELTQDLVVAVRDNLLRELFMENDELKERVRELEFERTEPRRIRVPTSIGSQLQSMASSKFSYANIVIENGAYVRLES